MATTYNTNGFGITPGTGLTDYVTPFATTQGRLDTVVGSCPNILGYKSGSNWYAALGDGSTNDSTAINAILDAVNAAGGGYVYFPFKPDGYLIGTSLKKYANTSWIGDRTILIGDSDLTGSVVEVQDDHYEPGTTLYANQIFMKGFHINCNLTTADDFAIIRAHDKNLYGQIFEDLFLEGHQASNHFAGIRIFGEAPKYYNRFSHITCWKCRAPSGAIHFAAGTTTQCNSNTFQALSFYNCNVHFAALNADDIIFQQCSFPQGYTGGIQHTSGVVTSGLRPRVRLHDVRGTFMGGYFDITSGEVPILWTTSAASEQYYPPIEVKNVAGLTSPDSILYLKTNNILEEIHFVTYVDANTFKLPYNRASTFTNGVSCGGWDGTSWVNLAVSGSSYSGGWTTVTVSSGNVSATLKRIALNWDSTCYYVADNHITTYATINTEQQVHGKKLYLFGDTNIHSVHTDYVSTTQVYLINDAAKGPGAAFDGCHSIATSPGFGHLPVYSFDTHEQSYIKTKTTDWVEIKLQEGRFMKVDLNTVAADLMITGPANLVSGHITRFNVMLVGHATTDYDIGWRGNITSSLTVLPAGWTAQIEFLWNGNHAVPVSEILMQSYYLSNYDPGSMGAGATDVHDVVFANSPGFLETDKIVCSYGQSYQRYKLKTSGVLKGGTTDTITVTITNIDSTTYNPSTGALFVDVIRTL